MISEVEWPRRSATCRGERERIVPSGSLTPLTRLDLTGSLEEFQNYCDQLSVTSDEFIQASGSVTQDLIVSQSEACIRAQARNLGADVAVTVTCEEQDGISVPSTVSITGELTLPQWQELTQWTMDAFDLSREQIQTETEKAEKAEGNK